MPTPPTKEDLLNSIPDDDQPFYGPDDVDFYNADGNKAATTDQRPAAGQ